MKRTARGSAVWIVVVGVTVMALACGDDGAPPTPTVDTAALGVWFEGLPAGAAIWDHCDVRAEADPAGTFTNAFLIAWDALALADGPDDPVLAGEWRAFVEAGTVWASAVVEGVDEPDQLVDLVDLHAELTLSLSRYLDAGELTERLPGPPAAELVCTG